MLLTLSLVLFISLAVYIFMQQPKFGKLPSGKRLERVKSSPNYRDGQFQNLSFTPDLSEDSSYYILLKDFFFTNFPRVKPKDTIPSKKTDLQSLDRNEDVLVWFGHSSYFLQVDGKRILVDPVFGKAASPLSFTTNAFPGTNVYVPDDIPEIDYLFISHDHWDHMDYETLIELKPKIGTIICGLGIGEHFEYWGFDTEKIIEKDWEQEVDLGDSFMVHTTPARHFSGRGFKRNQGLWLSFVLKTPTMNLFLGGDSGYDTHFKDIGRRFGPFDLSILENGQYDKSWKYIHLMPDQLIGAASDLNSKIFFPVHSAKFPLANHPWDEPLKKASEHAIEAKMPLITPMIGEKVLLKSSDQSFLRWWESID